MVPALFVPKIQNAVLTAFAQQNVNPKRISQHVMPNQRCVHHAGLFAKNIMQYHIQETPFTIAKAVVLGTAKTTVRSSAVQKLVVLGI